MNLPANILDASALVAFLLEEPGGEMVEAALSDAAIASINLGEVARRLFRSEWTRAEFENVVATLGLLVIDVDAALAIDAAELEPFTRNQELSSADRICLALAKREQGSAVTADRAWAGIAEFVGVAVKLIR